MGELGGDFFLWVKGVELMEFPSLTGCNFFIYIFMSNMGDPHLVILYHMKVNTSMEQLLLLMEDSG